MRKRWFILAGILALGVSLGRPGAFDMAAQSDTLGQFTPMRDTDRGLVAFAFGDWGGLTTDTLRRAATPTHLVNAALALQATNGDADAAATVDLASVYQGFGLTIPTEFANWPTTLAQPTISQPLGLNTGTASKTWPPIAATITNVGCPACHASVTYDETGTPDTSRVWLGAPNTSINLEAYTAAVFAAVQTYGDTDALLSVAMARAPKMNQRERWTLRYVIRPALLREFDDRQDSYGQILPFKASLAGATNGLGSLRNQLNLPPETQGVFASIPDLGGRLWRRSFLSTGGYAIAGGDPRQPTTAITPAHRHQLAPMISFFTVPSMGITPDDALATLPDAKDVTAWMSTYQPMPFPGEIDSFMAGLGTGIYAEHCAACHGSYDILIPPNLLSFPNWSGTVGTDAAQIDLMTQDLVDAVDNSPFGALIATQTANGYVAPPLTGIWSSAPYLHNGSVPTLWHLMHPDERPDTFAVGGHMIDLARVGIALDPPSDYVPWSDPVTINTGDFGMSHEGHLVGFADLTENEKRVLLEFLKTL